MLRKIGIRYLPFMILALLLPVAVQAAAPTVTAVGEISGFTDPTGIATDPFGRLYVTDAGTGSVRVFTNSGQRLFSIEGLGIPVGIAIGGSSAILPKMAKMGNRSPVLPMLNEKLYVGDALYGSVSVFLPNGRFLYKLGIGNGEFSYPNGIAVSSSTGMVYVVDSRRASVRVYNANGDYVFSFGMYGDGSQPGQFNFPTTVAVDDANSEVLVADSNLSKVQVFDLYGNYKRQFGSGKSGYIGFTDPQPGAGQFVRMYGVTVDSSGRYYVSDSHETTVQVFDRSGNFLAYIGSYGNGVGQLDIPKGLAFDGFGKLFVTSGTGKLEVYGIDSYQGLQIIPGSLSFEGQAGGPNPPSQSISINNTGTSALTWSAACQTIWLRFSPPSGTTPSTINVSVNIAGLSPGKYLTSIQIKTTTGLIDEVPVTLNVTPPPAMLKVIPSSLSFSCRTGSGQPQPQQLSIINNGSGGSIQCSASTDKSWITLSSTSGNTPSALSVSINPTNLSSGTYSGTITITSQAATNSPVLVGVTLNVYNGATINVTTNLPQAGFTIRGPAAYSGSGLTWQTDNAPSGQYTIYFNPVSGYKTPPSQSKTLTSGGSITFNGIYARPSNIIVSSGPSQYPTSYIRVFRQDGSYAGLTINVQSAGVFSASGDVDGDGNGEIIVSTSDGTITGYRADGTNVPGLSFKPFDSAGPVRVALADFGSGRADIIASSMDSAGHAMFKVFEYDPNTRSIIDRGISQVFPDASSITIAAGDIDGDGIPEIIVGLCSNGAGIVRAFKINAQGGLTDTGLNLTAFSNVPYGINVAAGDINGDGISEIIVSPAIGPQITSSVVKFFKGDGSPAMNPLWIGNYGGLEIASADVNSNGRDEIIFGTASGRVMIYNVGGALIRSFTAFNGMAARVSTGRLGL